MNKLANVETINENGCPENKCFLNLIHPNSDASLACDMECYFKKGEDGENYLKHYVNQNHLKFEQLFEIK